MADGLPTGVEDLGTKKTITLTYILSSSKDEKVFILQGESSYGVNGLWCYSYYKITSLDKLDFELKDNKDLNFNFEYDDNFTNMTFPDSITFTKCPLTKIIVELYIISGGYSKINLYNGEQKTFIVNEIKGVSDVVIYDDNGYIDLSSIDLENLYSKYIPLSTNSDSGIGIYGIYYIENYIVEFGNTTTTKETITITIPSGVYNVADDEGLDNIMISCNDEFANITFSPDIYFNGKLRTINLTIERYSTTGQFDKTYLTLNIFWLTYN
jgi:hypothetical protein